MSANRDNCLMLSETGAIRDILIDTVDNWKIVTDETAEAFYDKVMNILHNNSVCYFYDVFVAFGKEIINDRRI